MTILPAETTDLEMRDLPNGKYCLVSHLNIDVEFETESQAADFKENWRILHGLDPITGEFNSDIRCLHCGEFFRGEEVKYFKCCDAKAKQDEAQSIQLANYENSGSENVIKPQSKMPSDPYQIGFSFILKRGRKDAKEHTIIDHHITRNAGGEVVKSRYVTSYEFLGQSMTDSDMIEVTIRKDVWETNESGDKNDK